MTILLLGAMIFGPSTFALADNDCCKPGLGAVLEYNLYFYVF